MAAAPPELQRRIEARDLQGASPDEIARAVGMVAARVLAECPIRASDQLFPLATLDEAVEPSPAQSRSGTRTLALGVDVARYGADATDFSWIANGRLVHQVEYHSTPITEIAARILHACRHCPAPTLAFGASRLATRDALFAQLTRVSYRVMPDGRRLVRKRGSDDRGPSPDLADSLAIAWAAYEHTTEGPGLW